MAKKKTCAICGEGVWKPAKVAHVATVAGIKFTATVPGERCTHCNETAITAQTMEAWELAVAQRLGDLRIRTGEAFRFMRKAMGLSGVALAMLLDVSPETVSRWENAAPDPHAFVLLTALVSDHIAGTSATLDRLAPPAGNQPREPVAVTLPRLKAS